MPHLRTQLMHPPRLSFPKVSASTLDATSAPFVPADSASTCRPFPFPTPIPSTAVHLHAPDLFRGPVGTAGRIAHLPIPTSIPSHADHFAAPDFFGGPTSGSAGRFARFPTPASIPSNAVQFAAPDLFGGPFPGTAGRIAGFPFPASVPSHAAPFAGPDLFGGPFAGAAGQISHYRLPHLRSCTPPPANTGARIPGPLALSVSLPHSPRTMRSLLLPGTWLVRCLPNTIECTSCRRRPPFLTLLPFLAPRRPFPPPVPP